MTYSEVERVEPNLKEQRRTAYFNGIVNERLDFQRQHGREPNDTEMHAIDVRVQRNCGVRVGPDRYHPERILKFAWKIRNNSIIYFLEDKCLNRYFAIYSYDYSTV